MSIRLEKETVTFIWSENNGKCSRDLRLTPWFSFQLNFRVYKRLQIAWIIFRHDHVTRVEYKEDARLVHYAIMTPKCICITTYLKRCP